MYYRKAKIAANDLQKGNEYLIEILIKNNFNFDKQILKEYNFEDNTWSYFQEITNNDLLFIKFNWAWEPEWKRIKRLLLLDLKVS